MHQSEMADLPVVDADHHLIGIISHVDIGIALLRQQQISTPAP
jgi:CBS-domain-containing membrane protein